METEILSTDAEFQTEEVALFAAAHGVHDSYTGFLPALMPLLIQNFSLTNTTAGLLSLVQQIPSILQPFIGSLADRKNLKLAIILAPAVTAAAMSALGAMQHYGQLVFLLVLAGLSSASLHAIGPVLSGTYSGSKLGKGMSIWMVGGEFGRAMGPLVVVTALGVMSLRQLPWLMMAGVLFSVFLFTKFKNISTRSAINVNGQDWAAVRKTMKAVMLPIVFVLITRSLMNSTLSIFLPTLMTGEGATLWVAGASLTILQMAGVLGAFTAGSLSDRLGRRKMLVAAYVTTPIFMFLMLQAKGWWQLPFLMLTGFAAISVLPVILAVVLENFPNNRSLANGVYLGLNFLINALAVLLVGGLGDRFGLRTTFLISAALVPLGLPFIAILPKSVHRAK